jgi:hypothetical protein
LESELAKERHPGDDGVPPRVRRHGAAEEECVVCCGTRV